MEFLTNGQVLVIFGFLVVIGAGFAFAASEYNKTDEPDDGRHN